MRITSEETFREQYVHDLSRGGLFILSHDLLSVGAEVEVDLFPPGWSEPLALRGRVVRVADDETARSLGRTGMGVRFDSTPEWTRSRLEALIAQVRSQRGGKVSGLYAVPTPLPPPAPRVVPTPLPASAVWTPEELREAKLLELEDRLQGTDAREQTSAAHIAQLQQAVAEAQAAADSVREEKVRLQDHQRLETEALNAEIDRLSRMLNRRRFRAAAVILVLAGAGTWGYFSQSPLALDFRSRVQREFGLSAEGASRPEADLRTVPAPAPLPAVVAVAVAVPQDAGAAPAAASDAGALAALSEEPEAAPEAAGTLRIEVDRDTGVWVDGKLVGRAPIKPVELSSGNHRVRFNCRLEKRRAMSKPRYVQISPGREAVIEYICADGG